MHSRNKVPMEPTTAAMRHAVCLTGMERSFSEIGWNIHEAVHHMLRTPNSSVRFFGVRPANDSWKYVLSWFAFEEISLQRYCTVPVPRWYGCQAHGRTDCRHSFVQELCDLDQCEAMLHGYERLHGAEFHTVMRLRADVYWEARVDFPRGLMPDEVVVPYMESGSGLNDHLAFGGRIGMRVFLTRVQQLNQNITEEDLRILALPRRQKRLSFFSESFLKLALVRQAVRYRVIREWMYCLHTKRALLDQRGVYGCIARARARRRCASLMCAKSDVKYWCHCFNATCATVDAGVPVASLGPAHILIGAHKYSQHLGWACVDVQHSQLLHPGCPWRSHDYFLSYPGVTPLTWPVLPRNASRNTELQNCPQEVKPHDRCRLSIAVNIPFANCTPNITYGCIDHDSMWTARGCRAVFACNGLNVRCGARARNNSCYCSSTSSRRRILTLPPPPPGL